MAEAVHEYHHGDQDITENAETYRDFGALMKWAALAVATLVATLVVWFCTSAGFWPGFFLGAFILAVGVSYLRSRPEPTH